MQKATVLVNIGNDGTSIVPKYDVTPSEALVLEAIHGGGSVTSIAVQPDPAVDMLGERMTGRADIERIYKIYGGALQNDKSVVSQLFPGIGARALDTFDELGWEASRFVTPTATPAAPVVDDEAKDIDGADALS